MAITLHDLLALPVERDVYLSFPLFPKGGIIVIGAPSKYMKSFLALGLAYDLAEGTPLFGLQKKDGSFVWPVLRPMSVLYIEQEIGRARVKARMATIQGSRGGTLAPENIAFECKNPDFRLDSAEGVARIEQQIVERKADVLILDPMRRFHLGDEDSSEAIEQLMQPIYALQKKHGVTVVLIHHAAKRSEFRDGRDPESLRGSSHIYAMGDTYMMITRPVPTNKDLLQVDFSLRSWSDPPPLRLRFEESSGLLVPVQ